MAETVTTAQKNEAPPLIQEAQEKLSTLAAYLNYAKQIFSWGTYIVGWVNTILDNKPTRYLIFSAALYSVYRLFSRLIWAPLSYLCNYLLIKRTNAVCLDTLAIISKRESFI